MNEFENQIPNFKYCVDPLAAGLFEVSDKAQKCTCCGKETKVIYQGPFYTAKDVDVLCPACITSGRAAEQFQGTFIDSNGLSDEISQENFDELCLRTPSYVGYQQEYWPDHCGDFCEFVTYAGWQEIKDMGLEDQVKIVEDIPTEDPENIVNGGSCQGYLFRCLSCKQYILYTDCD